MIDIKDSTSKLVHDLGRLLLGSECFDGEFAINEANDIGNGVQLQWAVQRGRELVKSVLLPPHDVRCRLDFWKGGENVVFPKVNFPGDHAEDGRLIQGCGVIIPSSGTSDNNRYRRVCGRNSGTSVNVDGEFESNRFKNKEVTNPVT